MPTLRSASRSIASLVDEFAESLATLLEETSIQRARAAVLAAFGGNSGRNGESAVALPARRGRPPASASTTPAANGAAPARKRRKKGPIQMCPVPGCKNRAAPIFGMVCSNHKGVAKSKIRKFREARRL